jgi:hypothetical protein
MDRISLWYATRSRSCWMSGEVEGVLALRASGPASAPHLFRSGDDLGDLVLWPKYAIPKRWTCCWSPSGVRLGMVTRGCEERG